jgi:hypothetical protein
VTSVLHQLKAHCLKGDTEKSLPTIYHIAKAALVQQTGGGTMPPSFPNLELIRTRMGHDDWSPITNEQEATFDPSGYYALTPAKPASAPYTEVDDLEGAEGEI